MRDLANFVLRLGLGAVFMAHGLQKAFGLFGAAGIEGVVKMLSGLGFSPAVFWAYLLAYVELIGGLFLILGLFVRSSSILLLIIMTVAVFKVHLAKGFFVSKGGFEFNFVIMAVCIALFILGSGKFAITRKF